MISESLSLNSPTSSLENLELRQHSADDLIKNEYIVQSDQDDIIIATYKTNGSYEYTFSGTLLNLDTYENIKSRTANESPETRQRRLARNALRMREMRAKESEEQYRARLSKNALANRIRRQNENEVQRALRLMKNAARQRLRRASESPEERKVRLAKAAERMRIARANTPKIEKPPLTDRLIGY